MVCVRRKRARSARKWRRFKPGMCRTRRTVQLQLRGRDWRSAACPPRRTRSRPRYVAILTLMPSLNRLQLSLVELSFKIFRGGNVQPHKNGCEYKRRSVCNLFKRALVQLLTKSHMFDVSHQCFGCVSVLFNIVMDKVSNNQLS